MLRFKLCWRCSLTPRGALLGLLLWVTPIGINAEIYKWVDSNGRTHFSDKKNASQQAQRMDAELDLEETNQNALSFYPEADALLSLNNTIPQGKARAISAGIWRTGGNNVQNTSVLRFDFSELISLMNAHPNKSIFKAQLHLFANTDDKLYGQGVNNKEAAGHSTLKGDNAFYIKPTHNNWQEASVVWDTYYSSSHYIPSAIRNLPAVTVAGSQKADQDFDIDVKELIKAIVKGNIREVTLELKLQRLPSMAQVTFHSRESSPELNPRLTVDLLDGPKP